MISRYMGWASDIKINPTLLASRVYRQEAHELWTFEAVASRMVGVCANKVSETEHANTAGTDLFIL